MASLVWTIFLMLLTIMSVLALDYWMGGLAFPYNRHNRRKKDLK